MWGYQVFARKLTWYFIGVYIINIYITYTVPLKIRSTNKSRLFSGSRHSGIKRKIKQSIVKWIEPNCAFTITNFYLPYPLVFFIIIHFCILLFYYFFYPQFFQERTCVPYVQVATPLTWPRETTGLDTTMDAYWRRDCVQAPLSFPSPYTEQRPYNLITVSSLSVYLLYDCTHVYIFE